MLRNYLKHIKILVRRNINLEWPKASSEITDDLEYAKLLIQKYDKSGKNMIDFVEFCDLMEDLWGNADLLEEQVYNF